jgi:hypothetical protein
MTQVDRDLIGRQREQAELDQALAAAHHRAGGIVLLAGEAGVGKTRLLEECLARSDLLALKGQMNEIATPPYGPIAAALRVYLRARPGGLAGCGPLVPYLPLLLPELGLPPDHTDSAVLIEAICQAFSAIARAMPAVLILDDLQWADNATLELVPILASTLAQERLLIIGMYRNDEVGRGHPLRRLRNDLRRARLLREIVVAPLDQAGTTALATHMFSQSPGPALAAALYGRTEGVPLFVKELADALALRDRLRVSEAGVELAPGAELPIPDTLGDADADARACVNALAQIASATGQPEALSALAHALGKIALLDGDPQQAVQQFGQALDLLRDVAIPYCHASTQLRAGIACAAANQRDAAVAHLTNAYRTARKLGARPLATRIAQALAALGEPTLWPRKNTVDPRVSNAAGWRLLLPVAMIEIQP